MHYDPDAAMRAIDQHAATFLVLCGVSFVFNMIWFFSAMRLAKREQTYAISLGACCLFLAHDGSYAAHVGHWFGGVHANWFTQLMWFGLVLFVVLDSMLLLQVIKYGRREHAPHLSQLAWTASMLAGCFATMAVWWVVKGTLDDPLYLVSLALVTAACPPFGTALLIHRRGRAGQSTLMWVAFTGVSLFWWLATLLSFGDQFRSGPWITLAIVTTAWSVVNTWLVATDRLASPDRESSERSPLAASASRPATVLSSTST